MTNEKWRIVIESVGILAIVISLAFVAIELNQSQNSMEVAAMAARNEKTAELRQLGHELGVINLQRQVNAGEALSIDEMDTLRVFYDSLMWHLETIHFEYTQGTVDAELWRANINSLRLLVNSPAFKYVHPDWSEGNRAASHRVSFLELANSLIE